MSAPRYALFPARVTLADGTVHDVCRVATDTAGTTRAWAWIDGGPVEIWAGPADQLARIDGRDRGNPSALQNPDGVTLDARGAGCGCSHPLKSWRPALVAPRG